jgi:hypothetical protein
LCKVHPALGAPSRAFGAVPCILSIGALNTDTRLSSASIEAAIRTPRRAERQDLPEHIRL